ncbi:MAG: type II toxin-antitoxin system RelE family toxin [Thermoguttaceae bacterium]
MYKINYTHAAARDLRRLKGNRPMLERIDRTILTLKENPRPNGVEKLAGDTKFRVREGDYRIVFEIDEETKSVLITRVRDRKDAYRDL